MGLNTLPLRISGSVGADKADAIIRPYSTSSLPSGEWNNAAQAIVDVCNEVGLGDGTTPDSLKQKMNAIQAANIILVTTNSFLPSGSILTAGPNITINQNGSLLEITGSGAGGSNQFVEGSPSPRLRTTASLAIGSGSDFAETKLVKFYVSGSSMFGGNTIHSSSITSQLVTSSSSVLEVYSDAPCYKLTGEGIVGGIPDGLGNVKSFNVETIGGITICADLNFLTGDADAANSSSAGDINLIAGDCNSANGQSGDINLYAGDGNNEGGDIRIGAGDITGSSAIDAGRVILSGGDSTGSSGGGLYFYGGDGGTNLLSDANGGYVYLIPGSGSRAQTFPSGNFQGISTAENYYDEHGVVTTYGQHKIIGGLTYVHVHKFANIDYKVTASDFFIAKNSPNGIISSSAGSLTADTENGYAYISKDGTNRTVWARIIDETLTGSIAADHVITDPTFVVHNTTQSMTATQYQMAVSSSNGGGDSLINLPSTGLTNNFTYTIFDCKGTAGNASTDVYISSSILFSDDTSKKKLGNFGRLKVAYNSSKNRYLILEANSVTNA